MVKGVESQCMYIPTTQEKYEALNGTALANFWDEPMFSQAPGKAMLWPKCGEDLPDEEVLIWLAVANDATFTESYVLLVYQQILPFLQTRFGRKPDMVTDQNPRPQ